VVPEESAIPKKDFGGVIVYLLVTGICVAAISADLDGFMVYRGPSILFLKAFAGAIACACIFLAIKKLIQK
jgi:hypothetical protein